MSGKIKSSIDRNSRREISCGNTSWPITGSLPRTIPAGGIGQNRGRLRRLGTLVTRTVPAQQALVSNRLRATLTQHTLKITYSSPHVRPQVHHHTTSCIYGCVSRHATRCPSNVRCYTPIPEKKREKLRWSNCEGTPRPVFACAQPGQCNNVVHHGWLVLNLVNR